MHWILCCVVALAGVAGCSTDTTSGEATGSLNLNLVLAGGVEIDVVDWEITGNGMDMGGSIDVSAPGSTASIEVFGLPKGDDEDYTITLEATSVDGEVTCKGSEEFNVEPGETENVMVILNCKLPQRLGAVRVNGKFNICAELVKAVVSPLQTSVGNDIDLFAQGMDRDGDDIHYRWTGTGGSIDDENAASTTYTCQEAGDHFVNISVTDNDEYCNMAEWTISVACVPGDGGVGGAGGDGGEGGMGGAGGAPDPCADVTCPDDGNECTDETCNPANGLCETSNNTNACDDDTGTCDAGVCVPNPECAVAGDCPATGNECIDPVCNAGTCETSNNTNACDDDTGTCTAGVCVPNEVCEYTQDFEGLTLPPPGQTDFPPNSLSDDGWLVGGNEFESDGTFFNSYFSFPAPNGGPAFSAVVAGEGGPPQGAQQMSIYNDYNNANHGDGPPDLNRIIEAVVFRERTIVAADVGNTICFTFDAKAGNIEGATTAEAFIQVLDQVGSTFGVLAFDTLVTTNISTEEWQDNNTICVPIDGSLDGQLLQYGGRSRASNFEGSGIFYDNMNVCSAPTP